MGQGFQDMPEKRTKKERQERKAAKAGKENVFKRQELAGSLVEKTGLPRAKAVAAVDAVLETITEKLKAAHEVRLVGFGAFVLSKRKAGKGRDPRTGSEIEIGEATSVRFRPSKTLREAVSGKAAATTAGTAAASPAAETDIDGDEE
jgi:DNA-binding protein HU-beta